jgi:HEAT repeat protein
MEHFKLDGSIRKSCVGGKNIKQTIRSALADGNLAFLEKLSGKIPIRKLVNPVFSFFCDVDELVRWRSITLMGIFVSKLADQEMESARVIMRRLMWSLNDESGGIGWGAPEAMGEIMARHEGVAKEYAGILSSYIREDGNFLEHPMLQRGVIWGIGRLAKARPKYLSGIESSLFKFFDSSDPVHRGLTAWSAGNLGNKTAMPLLNNLLRDDTEIPFYEELQLEFRKVSHLAQMALTKIL